MYSVNHVHSVPTRDQKRASDRSPGTGVTDSCKPPCGCWESNLGTLEEQSMLLAAEPIFHTLQWYFKRHMCFCTNLCLLITNTIFKKHTHQVKI